ncbi:IS5 family transposase [Streptomyces rochei]|uniref:IS5 family transposase n=1 Tax=Streptomyces plicatus TaxID=1922 RepID=A0ABW1Y800_STRPL|nr:IS5 family transposase [Streptomyces sp. WAC08401]
MYERFPRWETDGTWAKLLEHVQVHQDAAGTVKWTISGSSTIARAHQHASGARAARTPAGDEREHPAHPVGNDQALGRSRGGLTTKIHLACDGRGLPLTVVVTPGNVNDSIVFDTVMGGLRVPRGGRTPPLPTRRGHRGQDVLLPRHPTSGRPPTFYRELYKNRNVVERCFARLKQFRAIATRFDELSNRYQAGLRLASLILRLREPAQDPCQTGPSRAQGRPFKPQLVKRCSGT